VRNWKKENEFKINCINYWTKSGIGNALAEKLIAENYFVIGTSKWKKNIKIWKLICRGIGFNKSKSIENANELLELNLTELIFW
jgi:hypothetical protein